VTASPPPRLASIAVIGSCTAPGCERPARIHVEIVVADRVVRGAVCERCERATRLGAMLLRAEGRRPA